MAFKKKVAPEADPVVDQMTRMKLKMKARPNWEGEDFGMETGADLLGISQEKIDALARDGIALQWATKSVLGMEMHRAMRQTYADGWTPIHLSDFDGILDDGKFAPKGADQNIEVDACVLVARPMAMHQKAKVQATKDANEQLALPQHMARQGINVSGGNHSSVRNQINIGLDRGIEIPD